MDKQNILNTIQYLIDNKQKHKLSIENITQLKEIQLYLKSGNKKKIEKAIEILLTVLKIGALYKFFKEKYFE